MANHRAPRRSASRTGTTNGPDVAAAAAKPASAPGKRKAVKPSKASRTLSRRSQTPPRLESPALAPTTPRHTETTRRADAEAAETRRLEIPRPEAAPTPAPSPSGARRAASAPRRAPSLLRGAAPEARQETSQPTRPPARRAQSEPRRLAQDLRRPVRETSSTDPREDAQATRPMPTVARRAASAARQTPPRRTAPVAGSRGSARKSGFPLLPSAPTAIGAAALVIAATGALTVADSSEQIAAAGSTKLFTPASALTGTSAGTSSGALDDRLRAVSRDSQRAALEDAANQNLEEAVEAQAQERNAALAQLAASAERYAGEIAANAWRLPLTGYRLTASYGESSGLWANTHTGLDFAAPTGTPVVAIAKGTVQSTDYAGAYGNRVVLALEDGTEIWYCHLNSFTVTPGESVTGGEQLGTVGSTGNSTGSHLHLEVRPGAGDPVDPYAALVAHGVQP